MSITIEIIVRFTQSTYFFNESDENIQLDVNLSIPASINIVIQVQHHNITAFSKFQ